MSRFRLGNSHPPRILGSTSKVIGERLSHVAPERRRHVAALLAAQPRFVVEVDMGTRNVSSIVQLAILSKLLFVFSGVPVDQQLRIWAYVPPGLTRNIPQQ